MSSMRVDRDAVSTLRADGLVGQRDRLRDVGPGGLDRVRRRRDGGGARAGRRARLQLLRHGVGLRQRPQRADCSAAWCATIPRRSSMSPPRSRPRTSNGPRGADSRSTSASRPTTSANMPRRACGTSICRGSTCSSSTSGKIAWARDERWQRAIDDLKRQGLIRAAGVSVNRWEPANVIETLRTGLDRRRSGHLQHLRPVARRTSCFPSAAS